MQFPKTIRAAKAVSTDEKAMAAAIFEEIPPRSKGRTPKGTPTIDDLLADLAIDLAAAGHTYSVNTLVDYRKVAAWAAGNGVEHHPISWQPVSWSMHYEAQRHGMKWETFVKHVESGVKTVDALRRIMDKKPTRKDGSEKIKEAADMVGAGAVSPEDTEALADALPDEAILATSRKRRRKAVEQQVADGEEGLTDAEIEETDAALEGLSGLSAAVGGAAADLGSDFSPTMSPTLKKLGEAEDKLVTATIYQRKHGVDHDEDVAFEQKLDDIKRLGDLLLMERRGTKISSADGDWLTEHGITI